MRQFDYKSLNISLLCSEPERKLRSKQFDTKYAALPSTMSHQQVIFCLAICHFMKKCDFPVVHSFVNKLINISLKCMQIGLSMRIRVCFDDVNKDFKNSAKLIFFLHTVYSLVLFLHLNFLKIVTKNRSPLKVGH